MARWYVDFTGWAEVEAEDADEAIDKAFENVPYNLKITLDGIEKADDDE